MNQEQLININMDQKRILIVEDEPSLVKILETELGRAGFGVAVAENALGALEMAIDGEPNLILLDLLLPNGDGQALLKDLKTGERTKNIPVVVLTNLADEETRKRCEAAGCEDFLVKADYGIPQLVAKINSILARSSHGR